MRDKLEAMKRLLALMSLGKDVSSFFPDVVKNVVISNIEVKKMVYMYIIYYADQNPDLALLSISAFQKDLTNPSSRIRADAMKAMASSCVPIVIQLVIMSIRGTVTDTSPIVRKAGVLALPKIYNLDENQLEIVMEILMEFLNDTDANVLGACMYAFSIICPNNLELLHPHYRRICGLLADFDEWAQSTTIPILTRYARLNFAEPPGYTVPNEEVGKSDPNDANTTLSLDMSSTGTGAATSTGMGSVSNTTQSTTHNNSSLLSKYSKKNSSNFYSDDSDDDINSDSDDDDLFGLTTKNSKFKTTLKKSSKKKTSSAKPSKTVSNILPLDTTPSTDANTANISSTTSTDNATEDSAAQKTTKPVTKKRVMDPDLALLLHNTKLLLHSSCTSVIISVASLFLSCAPKSELPFVIRALIRHVRNTRANMYLILSTLVTFAAKWPKLLKPYITDFYIFPTDPKYVREVKLDLLSRLVDNENANMIVTELQEYCRSYDSETVCRAIQTLGRVAFHVRKLSSRCLRILIALVLSQNVAVYTQAIVSTRILLQQHRSEVPKSVLILLATRLLELPETAFVARSNLIWILGEHRDSIPTIVPDTLREIANTFTEEHSTVKIQILNFATKLYLSNPSHIALLFKYIMDLCKYDVDPLVRDRARLIRSLFFKKKNVVETPLDAAAKERMKLILNEPRCVSEQPKLARDKFVPGTISHIIAQKAIGYIPLYSFPTNSTDEKLRDPEYYARQRQQEKAKSHKQQQQDFFAENDSEEEEESYDDAQGGDAPEEYDSDDDSDGEDEDDDDDAQAGGFGFGDAFFGGNGSGSGGASGGGFDAFFSIGGGSDDAAQDSSDEETGNTKGQQDGEDSSSDAEVENDEDTTQQPSQLDVFNQLDGINSNKECEFYEE